jgi:hypothetical protein
MVGRLKSIHSNDSDVIEVKQALLAVIIQSPKALISKEKSHRGNQDYPRPNFSNLLDSIILNEDDSLKATRQIKILISKITYDQIGLVIRELDSRSIKFSSYSYAFVSRDFGLEVPFLFSDSNRIKFLKLHETLSEQELYKYYLNLKGVNFETNSQLDFQKIYQILKFDITTPFARGASGIETNHVYAIIKVLELEFETSLGYPKKLCNSDSYSCSCYGRAYSWMSYLEQYGLVILNPGEAPSFSYPLSHDFKFMSR